MCRNDCYDDRETATGYFSWEEDSFPAARMYLGRVRGLKQKLALLEERLAFRTDEAIRGNYIGARKPVDLLEERRDLDRELKIAMIQVTDLIGRLEDAGQQMVMTRRYVDMKTWIEIAEEMDIGVRAVQKLHGKALPILDRLLREEG